jgi:hypothetical protein
MPPFGWNRLDPLPQFISVQGPQNILKIQQCLGWCLTVNTPVKIAGSAKVLVWARTGTTEEVSVIDEIGIQTTIGAFFEDGLPVVDVLCADIN